jgi:hypothetical protein
MTRKKSPKGDAAWKADYYTRHRAEYYKPPKQKEESQAPEVKRDKPSTLSVWDVLGGKNVITEALKKKEE